MNATPTTRTPPKQSTVLRRDLRASTIEGVLTIPIGIMSLPVNIFITSLVAKGFPLSKPVIGGICSMPSACNFLQVFITPLVTRWLPAKPTAIVAAALHALCWGWLALMLPSLSADDPLATGRFLLLWVFVSSLFNAVFGVVWNGCMHDLVPARLRGRYFSQRNRISQGATLAFVLSTGCVLAWGDYSARAFQAIIGVACVCRVASLYYFSQIHGRQPTDQEASVRIPLLVQLSVVRRSHSLLLFIAFGAVWSFAANCFGPFYQIFLFEQLNLSGFRVSILSTLSALGGILSLPVWGGLIDRYGNKACMAVALGLWMLQSFLWCIITPANCTILYGMFFWGGFLGAGFVLGQFTMLLKLIPPEARSLAIGLNLAVPSTVAALSPVVGGQVLGWMLNQGYAPLDVYHAAFLVMPVAAILSCILLLRIKEPVSSTLSTVVGAMLVGAMRNIRTLSGVLGLSFFVNYLFVKPSADNFRRFRK